MRARTAADDAPHDVDWLSDYLGIPKKTIYNWHLLGKGPPAYKVGRFLRYRKSEVDQWLADQRDLA